MKIIPFLVEKFAKYILSSGGGNGGVYFEGFKRVVQIAENSELKGKEKAALAFKEFEKIGYELTLFAMNIGIELAVIWLNSQQGNVRIKK